MGIRFHCPNGHKINVKAFLAGKRALCPTCGAKVVVPYESEGATSLASAVDELRSGDATPRAGLSVDAASPGVARVATGTSLSETEAKPLATVAAEAVAPEAKAASPAAVSAVPLAATPNVVQPASVVSPAAFAIAAPPAPLSDPIAEAPHAVWYVRPRAGGQFGPAPGDVFRQWITERRVAADSLVWRDGWTDWRLAGDVLPQFASLPPPALFGSAAAPAAAFSLPGFGLPAGPTIPAAGFGSASLPGTGLAGAAMPGAVTSPVPLVAAKPSGAPVIGAAPGPIGSPSTAATAAATPVAAIRGRRSWINSPWVVAGLALATIGLIALLVALVNRLP